MIELTTDSATQIIVKMIENGTQDHCTFNIQSISPDGLEIDIIPSLH